MKKTLFDLATGDIARIVSISNNAPACVRMRLLDMGITKGATLKVERHAPLGDPVEIVLKGYHLAIRMSEARNIEVEPIEKLERVSASSQPETANQTPAIHKDHSNHCPKMKLS